MTPGMLAAAIWAGVALVLIIGVVATYGYRSARDTDTRDRNDLEDSLLGLILLAGIWPVALGALVLAGPFAGVWKLSQWFGRRG